MQKNTTYMKSKLVFVLFVLAACLSVNSCKSPEISLETQSLNLKSVNNARDLGGYRIGRKEIVKDQLIRSARLSELSPADSTTLADVYHLAYIFDFRSVTEAETLPDVVPGKAEHIALPFSFGDSGSASSVAGIRSVEGLVQAMLKYAQVPGMTKMVDTMYDNIFFSEAMQQNYHKFLEKLCEIPEGSCALWHCSQGKDRAGVASALVLAALGADRDLIVKDFTLSKDFYDPFIANVGEVNEAQAYILNSFISANPELFEKSLDKIDAQYGSLDAYLEKCIGVTPEMKQILREKYLR